MPSQSNNSKSWRMLAGAAALLAGLASLVVAAEPSKSVETWSLRDEFRQGSGRENPNPDREGEAVWHFLRTTTAEGPVESRRWGRDGKYVPLAEQGGKLFDSPLDGWAYRIGDSRLAPLIGVVTAEYDVGLKFRAGDMLIAPGPEHAAVVAWRSPVAGKLEVQGSFEHAQSCCGVNSQIRWYVERGPAPDIERGVATQSLAAGAADFGAANQLGEFHLCDLEVRPDDYLYFIVDAAADGTATPHHGDATRFQVTITVRDAQSPPPPTFERDIAPLFARHCHECHGADAREAQLDLRSVSEILRGGESGPAVVRGAPRQSLLWDLVATGQMPPDRDQRLSAMEIATLRRWIKAGTPTAETIVELPPRSQVTEQDRNYWAFQPPRKPPEPAVKERSRLRTPVDLFVLSKLEAHGLGFSPDADRATLVRRLYFDLLGLPPEPAAVRAFVEDPGADAYERLVDELLQSPRYGERWGRHWLDAAGYVDGKLDNDLGSIYPNQGIWRYRDYVIRAFNEDKPYDEFLTEQLAGDELVDWRAAAKFDARTVSLLTATGFLRNVDDHTDFPQYGIEKRYEVINETLDMVSTAVLGLTLECCRCHNHKYDPLPQLDYYRLMSCFEPAFNVHAWKPPKERFLADVSPMERVAIDQLNAELDRKVTESNAEEGRLRERVRERVRAARRAALPEAIRDDVKAALETPAERRTEVQKYLAGKFPLLHQVSDGELDAALETTERSALQASAEQRSKWTSEKRTYGLLPALWDVGPPPLSHVHRRGNPKAPGALVQPGFPQILSSRGAATKITTSVGDGARSEQNETSGKGLGDTSGRRLALARWLTQPDHPLTARVFVNRIWHHHFGRGIVETVGNFGHSGSGATHPELLDWLASDFVEQGWSVKQLHRRMVLSTTYRQASRRPVRSSDESGPEWAGERIDPDNRWLWRMNLRRLEAELVRDSVLAASGTLDRTLGGPPVEITSPADGSSEVKGPPDSSNAARRSVYLFARRVYPLKFLEVFDAPIMPVNCTQRANSATVLQSLALLHSEFMFAHAERMAGRLLAYETGDEGARVELAFQIAYARVPSAAERERSIEFLEAQRRGAENEGASADEARRRAWADLCQMLLSANEFLYVE